MRLRPGLVSDYRSDAGIFRSVTQRVWFIALVAVAVYLGAGGKLGPINLSQDVLFFTVTALFASIGAIGLNIITGMAGQISLGHAFFLGLGAFPAAILGGGGGGPHARAHWGIPEEGEQGRPQDARPHQGRDPPVVDEDAPQVQGVEPPRVAGGADGHVVEVP